MNRRIQPILGVKNDTSVPWPMAFGSIAARLAYSPYLTLSVSTSSERLIIVFQLRFDITHHFIHFSLSEDTPHPDSVITRRIRYDQRTC